MKDSSALIAAHLLEALDDVCGGPESIRARIVGACLLRALLSGLSDADQREVCLRMGDLRSALQSLARSELLRDRRALADEFALLLREAQFIAPVLKPGKDIEEARELAASLRFSEASAQLNSYLWRYPRCTEALLLQVELLASFRKWEDAYELWRRIPAADWCEVLVIQLSARLLFRRREFESAAVCLAYLGERSSLPGELSVLRAICERPPEDLNEVSHILSEWFRTENVSSESLADFKRALAVEEGGMNWSSAVATAAAGFAHPRVLGRLLGETLSLEADAVVSESIAKGWFFPAEAFKVAAKLQRAERERAIRFYRFARTADPRDEETRDSLLKLEYAACAQDVFRSRLSLDSLLRESLDCFRKNYAATSYKARLSHGRILRMAERFGEASQVLEELARESPKNPSALRELVLLFQSLRDTDAVAEWSRRILELCPGDEEAALDAMRADRIRSGDQAAALATPSSTDSPPVWLEYLRGLFFRGDFHGVLAEGERPTGEGRTHLLVAAAALELGELEKAGYHLEAASQESDPRIREEIPLFQAILAQKNSDVCSALRSLNAYFGALGVRAVDLDESCRGPLFDQFAGRPVGPPSASGPLVSVILTCGNVVEYVDTSVRSILQQSHGNLELLVVDDASSDGTAEKLRQLQAKDSRLFLLRNETNTGTYVSKNRAMKVARGKYVAFQDADDWSHPDRILRCVAALERHAHLAALRTQWIRMTSQGEIKIRPRGGVAENCCISLFMRRSLCERIGYFDSVRVDADIEYVHRLRLAAGPSAFPDLPWMLMFGRVREGALTNSGEFEMTRGGYNRLRQEYRESYRAFHRAIVKGRSPYLEFPLSERKFEAPPEMIC